MESLIGKLSLDRLLSTKTIKITKSDVAAMVRFNKSIPTQLANFLNLKKPVPYKVPKTQIQIDDFDDIMSDLDKEWTPDEAMDKLKNLSSEEAQAFMAAYGILMGTLRDAAPKIIKTTPFGIEYDEPSNEEVTEFIWLCRFVHDVSWLFELMNANILTQSDVELFSLVYPDTYENIKLELATLLIEKMTDKKLSTDGWKQNILATLLMTTTLSSEDILGLQAGFEEKDELQPPKDIQMSSQQLTQSQQLEGSK